MDLSNETEELNMDINISNHIRERYAERVMGKDESIQTYVATHTEQIDEFIKKLVEYGTVIFEGTQNNDKGKKTPIKVYRSNLWLLLVATDNNTAVTLFKVDLGVGEEFDEQYLEKMIGKLRLAEEVRDEKLEAVELEIMEKIDENRSIQNDIDDYRKRIKSLEALKSANDTLIAELNTTVKKYNDDVNDTINTLLHKKVF